MKHENWSNLIDYLKLQLSITTDCELASRLALSPVKLCHIRKRGRGDLSAFLISAHEETNLSVRELKKILANVE